MTSYAAPLAGGLMIGASAALMLLANGRVAGVSGILGAALAGRGLAANFAFLAGLAAGPWLYVAAAGHGPDVTLRASWLQLVASGLLVG